MHYIGIKQRKGNKVVKNGILRIAGGFISMILIFFFLLGGNVPQVMAVISIGDPDNPEVERIIAPAGLDLPFKAEHLIVKMKDTRLPNPLAELKLDYAASSVKKFRSGAELIQLPGISNDELAKTKELLSKSSLVEYVEYDYRVYPASYPVNDPLFFRLWGLQNTGQIILLPGVPGIDINAVPAWEITRGSSELTVAILDTGIDLSHPELQNRAWVNPGEIPGNGIDDDNNGYVDDVNGYDFYNQDGTVYDSTDQDVHGTHVAGTLAAEYNNRQGICGVAPNIKIMALKFIGPDGGSISDAISAIEYAAAMGVKISNNSWSGTDYSQALQDAIEQSAMLFVAAAGNSRTNADLTPEYPAAYDCDNIISVAAINNRGNLPFWSNYGPVSVDLGAPGAEITSINVLIPHSTILYVWMSGTSQAAPHVTGTAALILSQYPQLSALQVKERILNSVKPLPSLQGKTVSGGMVDAYAALTWQP